jgi:hypothetical protein
VKLKPSTHYGTSAERMATWVEIAFKAKGKMSEQQDQNDI